jgi:NADPH:quinone reductase-like Zn-dependent oxidoreductase
MKAAIIDQFGDVNTVKIAEMPIPKPADNEVQVQIKYAAVNPVDWKICSGMFKNNMKHEFPIILGWDASGVITVVGKNAGHFNVGDEVFAYCRKTIVKWGSFAEYICLDAQHVALKPKDLSFAEAASIPLTGLTAWQSLFHFAKLKKSETILIHAGAGGVGGMAIQFAKNAGAKIAATSSQKNQEYVKKLGAHYLIDYEKEDVSQRIKQLFPEGLDVVFDTVGGNTLRASFQLVKKGGRLVSIVDFPDQAIATQLVIQAGFVFVAPNGAELKQIADLMTAGKVIPPAIEEMRLEDAKAALQKIQSGHVRGKIVLRVA